VRVEERQMLAMLSSDKPSFALDSCNAPHENGKLHQKQQFTKLSLFDLIVSKFSVHNKHNAFILASPFRELTDSFSQINFFFTCELPMILALGLWHLGVLVLTRLFDILELALQLVDINHLAVYFDDQSLCAFHRLFSVNFLNYA